MNKGWPIVLAALLACGGSVLGQTQLGAPVIVPVRGSASMPAAVSQSLCSDCAPACPNSWGGAEVLLWWVRSSPLPPKPPTWTV